ncbi:MAG: DUF1501 domain-containing protein, partial [Planctomycetes bacterium]|nr:DUF1501 domain-containing protein [Planctomycetota bacterium]
MTANRHSDSNGVSRREVIRQGLYGAAGVLAAGALGPRAFGETESSSSASTPVKAKSVIQIFLWGGMSHNDTWDPKPGAGRQFVGDFGKAIQTSVTGLQLSQLFPQLAQQADKFSLIRGMTHGINGHETAAYLMQTGHSRGERLAYPSVGAVFSLLKKEEYEGILPPYVVLTRAAGRFSEEGFLGPKYKPFVTGGDPNRDRFEVEGIIAPGIS